MSAVDVGGLTMESLRRFAAILAADLRERSRSLRFRAVLLLIAAASWWCFPAGDAGYYVLGVDGQRGQYSSAWIGMVLSMLLIWLSLLGFFVVRGSLARDIDSNVWQLLVATPMRRPSYLLAKWASNLAVLGVIVAAALLVGLVAQWVRAEDRSIDVIELLKPVLLLGLPSLAMTAMAAVLFDLVPWLRRTAGSVVYVGLWIVMLATTQASMRSNAGDGMSIGDPIGIAVFDRAVHARLSPTDDGERRSGFCVVCGKSSERPTRVFAWSSWQPRSVDLPGRAFWLGIAIALVLVSARFLDRAAAVGAAAATPASGSGRQLAWLGRLLSPLDRWAAGRLVAAELQMTLRQRRLWWWLAMLVVWSVQAFAEIDVVAFALVAAWLLSLDVWSRAALREIESHTAAVVFSSWLGDRRILLLRWTMLLLLGLLLCLPALLRFAVVAPGVAVAIAVVCASLPAWGLALGAITRNSRSFELLLCIGAYLAFEGLPALNVVVDAAASSLLHLSLLPLAALALFVAWPRLRSA